MDTRFLIRLTNPQGYQPADQPDLQARLRHLSRELPGKVINLRVDPNALEFDLFVAAGTVLEPFFRVWASLGTRLTVKPLDLPQTPMDVSPAVAEARHLFNEHRYWEVHEVLEAVWKGSRGREKELVQGLILAAAAFVHVQKNEMDAAWGLIRDALQRLRGQPDDYHGWNVEKFRDELNRLLKNKTTVFPTV